jgi:hypothetical protein
MANTVDDFVSSVKVTATVPENQALITTLRLLSLADEEIQNELIPLVTSLNQEFFVTIEVEQTVAGQQTYKIPYRSIGRTLRDLKVVSNNTTSSLTKIAIEDEDEFNIASRVMGFNIKGDKIWLYPTPTDASLGLKKYYLFRPSKLVETSAAARITGISGNIITCSSVPSDFVAGVLVDFVEGQSGYSTLAYDQTITNVVGVQVTVATPPTDLEVGDYLTMAEETPVIQFPDEMYSYLVQRTAKRILEAIGDFEGSKIIAERLPQARKNIEKLLAPRTEGASTKIIQRNGLIRGRRNIKYFRGNVF